VKPVRVVVPYGAGGRHRHAARWRVRTC
jgi:hypothetical protein